MNALYLAFAHLRWNWARSLVLVVVGALILAVPMISEILLRGSEDALTRRAESTPQVIGARGSQLDLVMDALYFSDDRATPITMAASESVWDSGLALPIPLYTAFDTHGARIVGTTLDYFEFRQPDLIEGRLFAVLGEAVIGSALAERLGLGVGDTLVSSPQNLFDLDGVYPLEMSISGVLAPSGTPDDHVLFTDVKTSWVIAGIGHGHDDVISADEAEQGNVTANAALLQFNRITEENIDSFHFHGSADNYPLSAVIVAPHDTRSATILRGRYLDADNPLQLVLPDDIIADLVDRIFRIATLLDAVTLIIGVAAAAAMGLSLFLSWRLRAEEMATAWRLGAGRGSVFALAGAEILIILSAAICLAALIVLAVRSSSDALLTWLLAL